MFVFKTNHLRQVKTLSNHIAYYSNACESLRNVIKERDEKLYGLEDSLRKAQESAVFWEKQYTMQLATNSAQADMLKKLIDTQDNADFYLRCIIDALNKNWYNEVVEARTILLKAIEKSAESGGQCATISH